MIGIDLSNLATEDHSLTVEAPIFQIEKDNFDCDES